ncbi:hypothetical protein C2845_PM13G11240 [Panicum miliaceum]|uniref:Disease resistance protein RPM1-like n=1 Tax=Panicum miliaceum TaxID=4540 RepID=A0A3L6RK46_PANMI|nr:hypothetical protein C2845_PM13G11240 [Panicum miliaceum]
MAGAIMSAATGALASVVEKLAALLGEEYNRFKGVRGEILFLKAELEHMHAFLAKMSRVEDPDEQAKCWMAEVRELSYDIEDSIDEFMLCVDGASAGFRGFIERCTNLLTEARTRRRIAKEIQNLRARVQEVGDRRQRYMIDGNISMEASYKSVDPRVCSLYNDMSQLVGIDRPEELIRFLKDGDGASAQQLKVVSVVGFGGLGKTTLANQVYHMYGSQFDYWAFVSISRNPDLKKVLRIILSQVSNQMYSCTETGDERLLIDNISNFLEDKRYFIVIDDIWTVETWDTIKCAIPQNTCGSRIITTTRIKEVAESCCFSYANLIYELRPLCPVDSKRLFLKRIFHSEEQCPPHLNRISGNILRKCGGSPLAIIAISGLLANKAQTVDEWDKVQKSIGYSLERYPSVERMMRILSLSYFDLQHELKTCLLYLSIFPEDFAIEKSRLIRRWIAEGFIHRKGGMTRYELGERCFNELINRSLIQPSHISKSGEVEFCQVHDTILDFIVYMSVEQNFVTVPGVPNPPFGPHCKVRRLSFQHNTNEDSILMKDLIFSHVRSISVFGRSMEIPPLAKSIFLRVLDLEGCDLLSSHHLESIGNLFKLKYLSFKNTRLSELPEHIGELRNLETLNLERTSITELPATIVQLKQLVHLLIDRNVRLPEGIANMQALEELKIINIYEQTSRFWLEISLLSNLRDLSIFGAHPVLRWNHIDRCKQERTSFHLRKRRRNSGSSDAYFLDQPTWKNVVFSICKLGTCNLRSLSIDSYSHGYQDVDIKSWHPVPHCLQNLAITGGFIKDVPIWVGSLANIQKLELNVEEVWQDNIQRIGSLPALLYLNVCIGPKGRVQLEISSTHGFTCLRHLRIGGSDKCALGLMFERGSMPKLEELVLVFDAEETSRLCNLDFVFGVEHLPCLTSIDCDIYSLGEILPPSKAVMVAMDRVARTHPNHPKHRINILG